MSYHESYWIAIAAAAPVIGLANTVTMADATSIWFGSNSEGKPKSLSRDYKSTLWLSRVNFLLLAWQLFISLESLSTGTDFSGIGFLGPFFITLDFLIVLFMVNANIGMRQKLEHEASSKVVREVSSPEVEDRESGNEGKKDP